MNVPSKGAKGRLFFGLLLIPWFFKFIFGFINAVGRKIPSYPDAVKAFPYGRDIEYYVVMPAVFVALNLLLLVFARKLPKWLTLIAAISQFLLLLVILFLSTGGI
jgi:hypothetical protein